MFETLVILLLVGGFLFYLWWITHTKDAPWVPMDADVAARVVKIAEVGPEDVFYDLGSGDGRLVIAAAMQGAKAYGVEIDFLRVLYSRFWIWLLRLGRSARILHKDIFKADISQASVICTYLIPKTHQRLKQKLVKELKKGTKIIAVAFEYEGWKPVRVDPRGTIYGPIILYRLTRRIPLA